jgi:hypothetical protein
LVADLVNIASRKKENLMTKNYEEQQIEAMAKVFCIEYGKCGTCSLSNPECETPCTVEDDCKTLYEAGFRKPVSGVWNYYSTTMMECSICGKHVARHRYKFCPECGTEMEMNINANM